jgi:uncharacterized protein (TIGR02599 family)
MKTAPERSAFTLVEVLVSTAIVVLLGALLLQSIQATSLVWRSGRSKIEQFREARDGFEAMTRRLSVATLNTYYDYLNNQGRTRAQVNPVTFIPQSYARYSELRFISGPTERLANTSVPARPTHGVFFQAPLGVVANERDYGALDNLLNTWGYFIEFGDDAMDSPEFLREAIREGRLGQRHRYRLMEFREPSERLRIYNVLPGVSANRSWFTDGLLAAPEQGIRPVRALAGNIVALVLLPRPALGEQDANGNPIAAWELAPTYEFDSTTTGPAGADYTAAKAHLNTKNQLPPVMQVVMVAIDEISAQRLADEYGGTPPDLGIDESPQLFRDARKLEETTGNESDLQLFESRLRDRKINYRTFSSSITLRGAKWSRSPSR